MNLRLKRTPGIYLVGFMGSGKTTVGRHLADRLGWSFFDTDAEIEHAEKMAIAAIFDPRGEAEFRRIEAEVLREHVRWIERGRPAVLALGGGAFAQGHNRSLLVDNGVTVWLDCPFDIVQRRVAAHHGGALRPLARDPQKFEELWTARRSAYQLADVHVAIDCDDPEPAVAAILAHPILR
jgi:shikimate kinase